jgi:hypothetical protein
MINFGKLTHGLMWEMAPLIYKTTNWISRHPTTQQIIICKMSPTLSTPVCPGYEDQTITIATINLNEKEIIVNWKIKPFTTFEEPYTFPYEDPNTTPEGIAKYIIRIHKNIHLSVMIKHIHADYGE